MLGILKMNSSTIGDSIPYYNYNKTNNLKFVKLGVILYSKNTLILFELHILLAAKKLPRRDGL
jgi:hypothetical protein